MFPFIDAHCDTMTRIADRKQFLSTNDGQVDMHRLWKSGCALQFFALWLDPYHYAHPLRQTLNYIDSYYMQIADNRDQIAHVNSRADLEANLKEGKTSALLTLEGGEALEGDMAVLHSLYRLGVRGITLTWNNRNCLGHPSAHGADAGPLTEFGREVVREMNRLGMVVDVSHLSDKGFWDVLMTSDRPVIASHSNARALCPHSRNLLDEQIKALADCGGVMGLNLYRNFLTTANEATMDDVVRHAEHILNVGGENVLGMGCDFDGIEAAPVGLEDVSKIPALFARFQQEFGERIAMKIAYDNFLRVLGNILP